MQYQNNQISRHFELAQWVHKLLEINKTKYEITQAYTPIQRRMNNA